MKTRFLMVSGIWLGLVGFSKSALAAPMCKITHTSIFAVAAKTLDAEIEKKKADLDDTLKAISKVAPMDARLVDLIEKTVTSLYPPKNQEAVLAAKETIEAAMRDESSQFSFLSPHDKELLANAILSAPLTSTLKQEITSHLYETLHVHGHLPIKELQGLLEKMNEQTEDVMQMQSQKKSLWLVGHYLPHIRTLQDYRQAMLFLPYAIQVQMGLDSSKLDALSKFSRAYQAGALRNSDIKTEAQIKAVEEMRKYLAQTEHLKAIPEPIREALVANISHMGSVEEAAITIATIVAPTTPALAPLQMLAEQYEHLNRVRPRIDTSYIPVSTPSVLH